MWNDYEDYDMYDDYDMHDDYAAHGAMEDGFYWANCGQIDATLDACTAQAQIEDGEVVSCTVSAAMDGFTFSEDCGMVAEEAGTDMYDMIHMLEWHYDQHAEDYSEYDYMNNDSEWATTNDDYETHNDEHTAMPDGFYWANCGQFDESLDACTARAQVEDGEMVSCTVNISQQGFTFSEDCEVMADEIETDMDDLVHMLEWNYDGETDYHASEDSDYDYLMSTRQSGRRGRRHH
jgi:major membrane immunogen (membrane-anchored lipoprotein)